MSQDASAGQSKRSSSPAYVYGPMVYQFPPEREGESEKAKPKNNQALDFLVPVLIVVLVIGGVVIYLRERGVDIRQLGLRRSFDEEPQIFRGANEDRRKSPVITQARVAADRL